jgi:hypothetical protein
MDSDTLDTLTVSAVLPALVVIALGTVLLLSIGLWAMTKDSQYLDMDRENIMVRFMDLQHYSGEYGQGSGGYHAEKFKRGTSLFGPDTWE